MRRLSGDELVPRRVAHRLDDPLVLDAAGHEDFIDQLVAGLLELGPRLGLMRRMAATVKNSAANKPVHSRVMPIAPGFRRPSEL